MIKRQIELLSLVNTPDQHYSVADLCEYFSVEVATIQRDLRELRSQGFQIHSAKNRLILAEPLSIEDYNKLLSIYLPLSYSAIGFPKNISLTTKKLKRNSLRIFVTLVEAIEKQQPIEISYYKVYDDETVVRRVEPYQLLPTTKDWRLIGKSEGIYKQFFVDNILQIRATVERFKRDQSFDSRSMFTEAWEMFRSQKSVVVRLLFSRRVARVIRNRIWSETEKLALQKGGAVLLTLRVADLDEIVGWVMSWGASVSIISPKALASKVARIASGILREKSHWDIYDKIRKEHSK